MMEIYGLNQPAHLFILGNIIAAPEDSAVKWAVFLAFSYAAFNEMDLVRAALLEALKLQPAMELSPMTTSPKILAIFQELQGRATK